MKLKSTESTSRSGIALFILLTSLIVISFGMSELILSSNTQASRVRNFGDRLQAIYIARSTTNLARALFLLDAGQKKASGAKQADTLQDLWAQPIPFPVPSEMVSLLAQKAEGEKSMTSKDRDEAKAFYKKCDDFFSDFRGEAEAKMEDLNSVLYLNGLDEKEDTQKDYFAVLENLLKPNYEFERSLSSRNLSPEEVSRQIRDYLDRDQVENVTGAQESGPYLSAQLDYGPKNQPIQMMDELRLLPSVDDELYEYLTHYVTPGYFQLSGRKRGKINLNTVGKSMFQALLKNVSNPEQVATEFIKHRKEKKFVYTDDNIQKGALKDNIGLESDNIRINLLTGVSDAFKIVTDVTVNQIKMRMESTITRTPGQVKVEPVTFMRVSP